VTRDSQLRFKGGIFFHFCSRSLKVIPTFVRLLYSDVEGIQRVAVGVLYELSSDKEGNLIN